MSSPLTILFFVALIVFIPTFTAWLWLIVSLPLIAHNHARLREYMAHMPALPADPAPETAEARRVREACNDAICATLDAGSIAVMAHTVTVRARK